jgi:hypothetical protein
MKMLSRQAADRRKLLSSGGAALVAGALASRAAAADAATSVTDYAVFTELSPESKPATAGWNTRVFTDTDARKGDRIQCDFATGVVTLAPGLYHITGMSVMSYFNGAEPPEMTSIRSPASAGYARLRTYDPNLVLPPGMRGIENSDPSIVCIGSPSTANLTPSLIEAYYEAAKTTQMILEHQSGSKPDQIYLRVYTENSKWHAHARLCIRRL